MRILLVVHGYPPQAVGGTELYTHDLAVALSSDPALTVFVLAREADPQRLDGAIRRDVEGPVTTIWVNNTFRSCTSFEDTYRNQTVLRAASSIVSEVRPDIVHVHHLTCLSTDLVPFFRNERIPVVLTLHDYWMLCHRGQLFNLDGLRCDGPVDGECRRCVHPSAAVGGAAYRSARVLRALPGSSLVLGAASKVLNQVANQVASPDETQLTKARFAHMRDVVSKTDVILAPSATIADRFAACGMPLEHFHRWDLGIRFASVPRASRDKVAPLRAGFVGSFIPTKAPHLLIEAARKLPRGSVSVDLAGETASYHADDSYRQRLVPMLVDPVVGRHGPVPHHRMPEHLSRVDVLVLPSVWLENSPLVIKEAFAAGVPVVTSDLGGMAEQVRPEIDGLVFEPGNADALASQLRRLQTEPGLLERLRAGIRPPMTIEQDAAALRGLYSDLISTARTRAVVVLTVPAEADKAQAAKTVTAVVLNYRTPEQTWLAVRSLQTSFASAGLDSGRGQRFFGRFPGSFATSLVRASGELQRQRDRAPRQRGVSCGVQRWDRARTGGRLRVGLSWSTVTSSSRRMRCRSCWPRRCFVPQPGSSDRSSCPARSPI